MKINTDKVKKRMDKLSLTEGQLGEKMEPACSRQYIHQILDGKGGKTLQLVARLAKALGFKDPREILKVDDIQ